MIQKLIIIWTIYLVDLQDKLQKVFIEQQSSKYSNLLLEPSKYCSPVENISFIYLKFLGEYNYHLQLIFEESKKVLKIVQEESATLTK